MLQHCSPYAADARRISVAAWEALTQRCGSAGPALSPQDLCMACLTKRLHAAASADAQGQQRDAVLSALIDLEGAGDEQGAFYVSRPWLL